MRLWQGIGFLFFCLLTGSRWLVDSAWPAPVPSESGQSTHYLVFASLALLAVVVRRQDVALAMPDRSRVAIASLLLLGVPSLLGSVATTIQPKASVALYALVPLCVIMILAVTHDEAHRALMMPALIGVAGALLLLPWQLPSTGKGAIAWSLVLMAVLATAAGSVWMHVLVAGKNLLSVLAVVSIANAAVLGLEGFLRGEQLHITTIFGRELLRAFLIEFPQLLLLLWLLREMSPERLASRFFLVPLITVSEGSLVLRERLDLRMGVGALLLLASSVVLIVSRRDQALKLNLP